MMTTTSCDVAERTERAAEAAGAEPLVRTEWDAGGAEPGVREDWMRGLAARAGWGGREGRLGRARAERGARDRASRLWRALAVSAAAHAVIGGAAATIVLSQPGGGGVDRRDLVVSLEMLGGMVADRAGRERPVAMAETPVAAERAADEEAPRERAGADAAERRERAAQEPERVLSAAIVTDAQQEVAQDPGEQELRIGRAASLAGWIGGPHTGGERGGAWTAFEARAERDGADGATGGSEEGRGGAGVAGVRFAGAESSGAVGSVVYVVDASGPMVTSLPVVRRELLRSVWGLEGAQRFNVVLFREDRGGGEDRSESFADGLVSATEANKRALARWLASARPEGRSNPLAGLERGLGFGAEVVFVLSRSVERSVGGVWGEGLTATMDRLERLNPVIGKGGRGVQIQSIAFLEDDPTGLLQAIAAVHGPRDGSGYRVVRAAEDLERAGGGPAGERGR